MSFRDRSRGPTLALLFVVLDRELAADLFWFFLLSTVLLWEHCEPWVLEPASSVVSNSLACGAPTTGRSEAAGIEQDKI